MECIDFLNEYYVKFRSWTSTIDMKTSLIQLVHPPNIVKIEEIFSDDKIKYDIEKSSIAVVFVIGNVFVNTSIFLISLVRRGLETSYVLYHDFYVGEQKVNVLEETEPEIDASESNEQEEFVNIDSNQKHEPSSDETHSKKD